MCHRCLVRPAPLNARPLLLLLVRMQKMDLASLASFGYTCSLTSSIVCLCKIYLATSFSFDCISSPWFSHSAKWESLLGLAAGGSIAAHCAVFNDLAALIGHLHNSAEGVRVEVHISPHPYFCILQNIFECLCPSLGNGAMVRQDGLGRHMTICTVISTLVNS